MLTEKEYQGLSAFFNMAKDGRKGFQEIAYRLKSKAKDKSELKDILDLLNRISMADGEFCSQERVIYKRVEEIFGFNTSHFSNGQGKAKSERELHLETLGLKDPVSFVR